MLLGIDVGGTFTDGVLLNGNTIVKTVKYPTDNDDLKTTLLMTMDKLLEEIDSQKVNRVVFSTTLVTNMLATDEVATTALLLIPGPGLPLDTYQLFAHTYFLQGSIDFRGRKVTGLNISEVEKAVADIKANGINKIAIVGKFSNRNSELEEVVRDIVIKTMPQAEVALGNETAGQLNFLRRIVTTYYSVMVREAWQGFIRELDSALQARGIKALVEVLKADGGTMPLSISASKPCETIFSGPAASTMGAVALAVTEPRNAVVIDIGGTTTDISLLIDGQPLYASKGAQIKGHYTHIKAFSVSSLALGGDSPIRVQSGEVTVDRRREGGAVCLGGKIPTVIDAFNLKYQLGIGEQARSAEKLSNLAANNGLTLESICSQVENIVISRMQQAIGNMFKEWENEPAYRVWEIVNGRMFHVQEVIGIGAASAAIVPILAKNMFVGGVIPEHAAVANAIGACVARPTLALAVHIDTEKGYYTTDQDGIRGNVPRGKNLQMVAARELARQNLQDLAAVRGMQAYADDAEFYLEEQFNVIRGWSTSGKIFDIGIQISPGLIKGYEGVSK